MKRVTECPDRSAIESVLLSDEQSDAKNELAAHLSECAACRAVADSIDSQARLEADLSWAATVRQQTPVDIKEPFRRLSEILRDYEILGELGRGGMGIVYKARQPKLDRYVAIKVLPTLLSISRPDAKERFRREAKLVAGLEHTGIISVYDFGEVDGTLYFTMQLIKGRSLSELLEEMRETGTFQFLPSERDGASASSHQDSLSASNGSIRQTTAYFRIVANWVADVADALQYAHERGVTHRDIKPSNLLVCDDGRIMISDFGLACSEHEASITITRSLMGTCRYLSPEQVDPALGAADELVDVYALGATLYEMLTLRPIFSGRDDKQILFSVLHDEPLPPHRHLASVPRELETICLKAIEKDRSRRYGCAAELADDLRRWLLDLPIQARRQSGLQRTRRLIRRRRTPIAMGVIVLLLSALSGALLLAKDAAQRRGAEAELRARQQESLLIEREAASEFKAEEFAEALVAVNHALELTPERPSLTHLKARILICDMKRRSAVDMLEEHVVGAPDDTIGRYLAGYALHLGCGPPPARRPNLDAQPVAEDSPRMEEWRRVFRHLELVQQAAPDSPEALCLQACALANHEQAIALLDAALELDPKLTEAWLERAERRGFLGQWGEAAADLDRAAELQFGGHRLHGMRGIAHYQVAAYDAAEEAFSRAIELRPQEIDWWYDRAVTRTFQGKYALAIEDATKAIEIDPQYAFSYVARARGYMGLGETAKSLADYNLAESIDPNNADIYAERCELLADLGKNSDALKDADMLVSLRPAEPRSFQRRADVYLNLDRWDDALRDLERSDEIKPHEELTWRLRGRALLGAGRIPEAADAFGTAMDLLPEEHVNYRRRSQALLLQDRRHEAVTTLTRWVTCAEPYAPGYMLRGVVYLSMHEPALAIADFHAAAEADAAVRPEAEIWTAIAHIESGEESQGNLALERIASSESGHWRRIALHLLGRLNAEALLAGAATAEQRAEAHCMIGVRLEWAGETARAIDAYDASAAHGSGGSPAWEQARNRRQRLTPRGA